jgi:hypothetical protein
MDSLNVVVGGGDVTNSEHTKKAIYKQGKP